MLGLVTVTVLLRRGCQTPRDRLRLHSRELDRRPIRFDPRHAPRSIRVLRTGRRHTAFGCVAAYQGRCIQELELEHYVRGVVVAEEGIFRRHAVVSGRIDRLKLRRIQEAWKLQAIAARTYAIYCILVDKYYVRASGFHLTDTPRDQAYADRRDPDIDRAVAQTRGRVLTTTTRPTRLIYAEYSA